MNLCNNDLYMTHAEYRLASMRQRAVCIARMMQVCEQ